MGKKKLLDPLFGCAPETFGEVSLLHRAKMPSYARIMHPYEYTKTHQAMKQERLNPPHHENRQSHWPTGQATAKPTRLDAGAACGRIAEGGIGCVPEWSGEDRGADGAGTRPRAILLQEGIPGGVR